MNLPQTIRRPQTESDATLSRSSCSTHRRCASCRHSKQPRRLRAALVRAAHRVRLASAIMCGERCALLLAARTRARLVFATTCGEGCAHLQTGTHTCPPRLRHPVRRARRAGTRGTRLCPPGLRHHVRRALRASAGGTRS